MTMVSEMSFSQIQNHRRWKISDAKGGEREGGGKKLPTIIRVS
jgi:hypothetical protein